MATNFYFFLLECFMIFPFVRFFGISVNNRPFNNPLFLLNGGRIRTYVWQGKPRNILSRLDLESLTVVTKAGDNVQFLFCGRWTHKTRCLVSRSTCNKNIFFKAASHVLIISFITSFSTYQKIQKFIFEKLTFTISWICYYNILRLISIQQ